MAKLLVDGDDLVVTLSPLEKLGAFSGDVRVPLAAITRVGVIDRPYRALRGIRVGTGIPFVIVLGRMYHASGKDFVAVYGTRTTGVIELAPGHGYERIMVSDPDLSIMSRLRERLVGAARSDQA